LGNTRPGVKGAWQTDAAPHSAEMTLRTFVKLREARSAALACEDARAPLRDEARRDAPDVRPDTSALVHALESHIKTLQGENEVLKQQLAAADARDAQHVAALAAEQARTSQAIEAFAALADRLDALAAERHRPWWRRLVR
jgi:N-acetyl-beta-hexosaminidase